MNRILCGGVLFPSLCFGLSHLPGVDGVGLVVDFALGLGLGTNG